MKRRDTLRLHLDGGVERHFTPLPEVEAALAYWRTMNRKEDTWARFESLEFAHERIIRVQIGLRRGDYTEVAYKTRSYFTVDGRVTYLDSVHC